MNFGRTSNQALESRPSDPDTPNQLSESSPSKDAASSTVVNGGANMESFLANQTIDTPPAEPSLDVQSAEESFASVEKTTSTQLHSSNTTVEEETSISFSGAIENVAEAANSIPDDLFGSGPEDPLFSLTSTSNIESAINNAIETAVEDTAATSTVPPIVEALESDLRHTSPPLATATEEVAPNLDLPLQVNIQIPEVDPHTNNTPLLDEPFPENITPADSSTNDLDLATSDLPQPTIDEPAQASSPATNSDMPVMTEGEGSSPVDEKMDIEMTDAVAPTTKVAREREDDIEAGPSAKRTKTEDEPMAQMESPAALENGDHGSVPISEFLGKEIIKILKNAARTKTGASFRASVPELWPALAEQYAAKITNPVDFGSIEQNIRNKTYPSLDAFYADLQLLEDNAVTFNGPGHEVSNLAHMARTSIMEKISGIPSEPKVAKAPKKAAPRKSTPNSDSAPRVRRPSKTAAAAPPPTRTFALDPATSMPTIRRDSTKDESGRPKREIKQPKNKDLAYHSVRPKSKKYGPELRFCEDVITELKKSRHYLFMGPFMEPVDPVALNIPSYFTIIKRPMDVSTVSRKLNNGEYNRASDFEKDVRLIISNCYDFNPKGTPVRVMGEQFQALFDQQWSKKDSYIASHAPAAMSPTSTDGEESDDDDVDEPTPVLKSNDSFSARLIEEQSKLITLMNDPNADPSVLKFQQQIVQIATQQAAHDQAEAAKKAPKKNKAPKQHNKKAAAPVRKGGAAPGGKKSNKGGRKETYMGQFEKEVISQGIQNLPDDVQEEIMRWVLAEAPDAQVSSTFISIHNYPY